MEPTKSKYYTPTYGDFYLGQELLDSGLRFKIKLYGIDELVQFFLSNNYYENNEISCYGISLENYRIKYLDTEDIESLGFEFLPKKSLKGLTHRYKIEGVHNRILDGYDDTMWWNCYLKHYPDRNIIEIIGDISSGTQNEKFFEGVVKNKSELKKVLQMLGIL
jgi:hypothetical protein